MNKLIAPLALAALTAALPSCSSKSTAPAPAPTQLSGRVASGSGSGTVLIPDLAVSGNTDSDGNFTLTLPDAAGLGGHLVSASTVMSNVGCSGTLTSSNPAARGYGFAALSAVRGSTSQQVYAASAQGHVASVSSELNMDLWVYADQDTQLSGSVDCTKLANSSQVSRITAQFINSTSPAVALKPGWNVLHFKGTSGVSSPYNIRGVVMNAVSAPGTTWRNIDDVIRGISIGF